MVLTVCAAAAVTAAIAAVDAAAATGGGGGGGVPALLLLGAYTPGTFAARESPANALAGGTGGGVGLAPLLPGTAIIGTGLPSAVTTLADSSSLAEPSFPSPGRPTLKDLVDLVPYTSE